MTAVVSTAPPPKALAVDVYSAADAARQRFAKKPSFPISLPNLRTTHNLLKRARRHSTASPANEDDTVVVSSAEENITDLSVRFNRTRVADDEYADKYQWAVLYENQRGCVSSHLAVIISV